VDVHRTIEDLRLVLAIDRVEELIAGQHSTVSLEESYEQPELHRGEGDGTARDSDLVAVTIDDQVAVMERLL
jgi:hypothetical protein